MYLGTRKKGKRSKCQSVNISTLIAAIRMELTVLMDTKEEER